MQEQTTYIAKKVDANGLVNYSAEENAVWQTLINRQLDVVKNRACDEYLQGLSQLQLPLDRVPQCPDVSAILQACTGWTLEPVDALISFDHFFYLLAHRRFPAATFIRKKEELDYLKEPDIFHEVFGHCPLLCNPAYAEFTYTYGKLGLNATPEERVMLARLYWFTVEFGLIESKNGLRAYGGGILSSKDETIYCVESNIPERRPFDVMRALQTPYRIDEIQPIYYVINNFDQLFELVNLDLIGMIKKAYQLDEAIPKHPC